MNKILPLAALIAAGAVVLLLVERCAGNPKDWERRLDSVATAVEARLEDRIKEYQVKREVDSAKIVSLQARVTEDSLRSTQLASERNAAVAAARGARLAVHAAEAELGRATTLPDTVRAQAVLITRQRAEIGNLVSVVLADSNTIRNDAAEKASLRAQLGVTQGQVFTERDRADKAERDLRDLMGAASGRPKGFALFGFRLELKPYLGYGLTYGTTTNKFDHGVQLGVSVLRG